MTYCDSAGGHIHVRECSYCRNEIDRHEVHYSCPDTDWATESHALHQLYFPVAVGLHLNIIRVDSSTCTPLHSRYPSGEVPP